VNSTLDLEEVLHLVANAVAAALDADACFVYLYDDAAGELVLRATHGTPLDAMTRRPRLRPGEGITGTAAAERRPVAIAANADLDPRWKEFPNLPESEYESILAVPILAREQLAGALNVRTRAPRQAVHRRGTGAARGDRPPRRRRARARPRGDARRPRPGDPPPRQEQPPDRRLAPAPTGARGGSRPPRGARALRQPDPRHRRGARVPDR